MNWLAHLFLSESSIDFQLANILADPLKARLWESASSDMHKGIKVHKIIDSFTDNNEIVKLSIKRLGKSGLLRAVVIDITYDYLLSKNWNKFSSIPLDMFLKTFYTQAKEKTAFFPVKANVFISNLIDKDILNKTETGIRQKRENISTEVVTSIESPKQNTLIFPIFILSWLRRI